MSKRGRKPNIEPSVPWRIHVKSTIAAETELILSDPMTGKPKMGARSDLINRLLREWLDKKRLDT